MSSWPTPGVSAGKMWPHRDSVVGGGDRDAERELLESKEEQVSSVVDLLGGEVNRGKLRDLSKIWALSSPYLKPNIEEHERQDGHHGQRRGH